MNNEIKRIYSNRDFQDFVNLNIKWLCFCRDIEKKNCRVHEFQMMMNDFLNYRNCEKLVRDFNCFCNYYKKLQSPLICSYVKSLVV